jgi:hypothetical protein
MIVQARRLELHIAEGSCRRFPCLRAFTGHHGPSRASGAAVGVKDTESEV